MFNLLREFERWLHQHIFKVGWLVTQNFQTTTILYYTFFLPGVFINQATTWLVAGMLDVHADRAISWPKKQEIGTLRLDFIKLSKKASPWKVAIIDIAPLFIGLVIVLFITNNIFDVTSALSTMSDGSLENVSAGIREVVGTTDFWVWAYLLFAISNTMMPNPDALKGWWWLAAAFAAISIPLYIIGVGDEIVGQAITGPITDILTILAIEFGIIIIFDFIGVLVLRSIEEAIERTTGNSATFKDGKMLVMTRQEAIEFREREKARQQSAQQKKLPSSNAPEFLQGLPSIYKLQLPIPGPPGKEPVTQLPTKIIKNQNTPLASKLVRPEREEPDVVDGETIEIEAETSD